MASFPAPPDASALPWTLWLGVGLTGGMLLGFAVGLVRPRVKD